MSEEVEPETFWGPLVHVIDPGSWCSCFDKAFDVYCCAVCVRYSLPCSRCELQPYRRTHDDEVTGILDCLGDGHSACHGVLCPYFVLSSIFCALPRTFEDRSVVKTASYAKNRAVFKRSLGACTLAAAVDATTTYGALFLSMSLFARLLHGRSHMASTLPFGSLGNMFCNPLVGLVLAPCSNCQIYREYQLGHQYWSLTKYGKRHSPHDVRPAATPPSAMKSSQSDLLAPLLPSMCDDDSKQSADTKINDALCGPSPNVAYDPPLVDSSAASAGTAMESSPCGSSWLEVRRSLLWRLRVLRDAADRIVAPWQLEIDASYAAERLKEHFCVLSQRIRYAEYCRVSRTRFDVAAIELMRDEPVAAVSRETIQTLLIQRVSRLETGLVQVVEASSKVVDSATFESIDRTVLRKLRRLRAEMALPLLLDVVDANPEAKENDSETRQAVHKKKRSAAVAAEFQDWWNACCPLPTPTEQEGKDFSLYWNQKVVSAYVALRVASQVSQLEGVRDVLSDTITPSLVKPETTQSEDKNATHFVSHVLRLPELDDGDDGDDVIRLERSAVRQRCC